MVDPVEYIWALFEETPRPSHLPPCLFPNEYPFELGFKYYPQPVVPVPSGPLSSYHDHDHGAPPVASDPMKIPIPGEPGAPPPWDPAPSPEIPPHQPDGVIPVDDGGTVSASPQSPNTRTSFLHSMPHKTYLSRKDRKLPPLSSTREVTAHYLSKTLPMKRKKRGKRCGRCVSTFCCIVTQLLPMDPVPISSLAVIIIIIIITTINIFAQVQRLPLSKVQQMLKLCKSFEEAGVPPTTTLCRRSLSSEWTHGIALFEAFWLGLIWNCKDERKCEFEWFTT